MFLSHNSRSHKISRSLYAKTWRNSFWGYLIESALSRPQNAAIYENADIIRQAATLIFGLIKSHPWEGGNKRTATFLTNIFLKRNSLKLSTSTNEIVEMVLAVESDVWKVDEIEDWLKNRVVKL